MLHTTWFKIAARNVIKNGRRSSITVMAIALGYAAVNLFGGFTAYMYESLREGAIYGNMKGHLTIFKQGFLEKGQLEPAKYLISAQEQQMIRRVCQQTSHVKLVTPQLTLSGLISNGRVSTIFIGRGIVPSALEVFRSKRVLTGGRDYEGQPLRDEDLDAVGAAVGLARMIDLSLGSTAVVMSSTVDGQINALDVRVTQLVYVAASLLEDKILMTPLSLLQRLYDTDGADRVVLLLDDEKFMPNVRKALDEAFKAQSVNFEVKSWKELSPEYRKTRNMFDVIFFFLFGIVFIIVVMSVVNTMSMAVFERIREIGTLRALGLKYRGILWLFGVESALLGILGTSAGLLLTVLGISWINRAKPMWTPPILANPIPLLVLCIPEFLLSSFAFLIVLCLGASLLPARRGARKNVVEALGHV